VYLQLIKEVEALMQLYEYKHVVSFEETNLVGNVYYANHIRWQGRCREMFLRDHVPNILDALKDDLALVTTHVACDYLAELSAFDELIIRMSLQALAQSHITMGFDYWRWANEQEELVARGKQQIACMRRSGSHVIPTPVPETLRAVLQRYRE